MRSRAPVQGPRIFAAGLAMILAGAVGCGASPADEGDGSAMFVAQNIDFKGFDTWRSLSFDNPNPGGATHVAGKRTVFINHLPPPGASEFPVGTIIVKKTEAGAPGEQLFARAKRGGAFNLKGAAGWEWFEIVNTPQKVVVIKWRGVGPPLGEVYGGDPNAGCNMCHRLAASNDFVLTPGLSLVAGADAGMDATTTDDGGTNADGDIESETATDDASHE